MYLQYSGGFKPLVQLIGPDIYVDTIIETLQTQEANESYGMNLVKLKEINLDYEIPCNNISKFLNKQGLIKNQWIEKVINYVPSVFIQISDWTTQNDNWTFKIDKLAADKQKYNQMLKKKKQRSSLIDIIFYGVNSNSDKVNSDLKSKLDVDSKHIHLINGYKEQFPYQIKKIKKIIMELIKDFYHKKYEKKKSQLSSLGKADDIHTQEKMLKIQFKIGILCEIYKGEKKALDHYQMAYNLTESILKYHENEYKKIEQGAKKINNLDIICENFDLIMKLEEIRYISDLILFRFLRYQLNVSPINLQTPINTFNQHFKKFKDRVKYFYPVLQKQEEYKWRDEIFGLFSQQILEIYKKNPIQTDYSLQNKIFSILYANVQYGEERYQGEDSIIPNDFEIFKIKRTNSFYFGKRNYQLLDPSKELDYQSEAKKIIISVIFERFEEEKQINIKQLNQTLLSEIEELKFLKLKQLIQIKFSQLKCYFQQKNYQNFCTLSDELIPIVNKFQMKDTLIYILENYLLALEQNQEEAKNMKINFNILLLKNEEKQEKEKRSQMILQKIVHLQNDESYNIDIKKINQNLNISVKFQGPKSPIIDDQLELSIKFELPQYLLDYIDEFTIFFNINQLNQTVKIAIDNNYTFKLNLNDLIQHNKSTIMIEKIVFKKSISTLNDSVFKISFTVQESEINFYNKINNYYLNIINPKLKVQTKLCNPAFTTELFSLEFTIINENKIEVSDIQIQLEGDFQKIKKENNLQPADNFLEAYFSKQKILYDLFSMVKKMDVIQEQILDTTIQPVNFYIVSSKKISFQLKMTLNYNLKSESGKLKPQTITDMLKINIVEPFGYDLRWNICSDIYLNKMIKKENIFLAKNINLPLNHICCLSVDLICLVDQLQISQSFFELNPRGKFQILQSSQISNFIKLKLNEKISFNVFIKTLENVSNQEMGNLKILFKRDEKQEENVPIYYHLEKISIEEKPFQLKVEAPLTATFGKLFNFNFWIKNTSRIKQKLAISISENSQKKDFMMTGKTKIFVELDPLEQFQYLYKLLPLETGKLKLPGIMTEFYVMEYKDKVFLHDTAFQNDIIVLP